MYDQQLDDFIEPYQMEIEVSMVYVPVFSTLVQLASLIAFAKLKVLLSYLK